MFNTLNGSHDQSICSVPEVNNSKLTTTSPAGAGEVNTGTSPVDARSNKRKVGDTSLDAGDTEDDEFRDSFDHDPLTTSTVIADHQENKNLAMSDNQGLLAKIQDLTDALTRQTEEHTKQMGEHMKQMGSLQAQLDKVISLMTEKDEELSRLRRQLEGEKIANNRLAEAVEREKDLAAAKVVAQPQLIPTWKRQGGANKVKGPAVFLTNVDSNSVSTQNRHALPNNITLPDEDMEVSQQDPKDDAQEADDEDDPQQGPSGTQPAKKKKATVGDKLPKEPKKQPKNLYIDLSVRELQENLSKLEGVAGKGNYYTAGVGKEKSTARGATEEINNRIIAWMDEMDIQYDVFPDKGDRLVKVALYKLGSYSAAEVKEMLDECEDLQVKPINVVVMMKFDHVEQKRVETSNFTVTFPPGTDVGEVKKVVAVGNLICKFDRLNKSKRPPYCNKCQRDGHVFIGCHHKVVCGKCGREHLTEDCTLHGPDALCTDFYCHRCKTKGHPAYYTKCPLRQPYFNAIARQKKANEMKQRSLAEKKDYNQQPAHLSAAELRKRAHKEKYSTPAAVQHATPMEAWANGPFQQQQRQQIPQLHDLFLYMQEQSKVHQQQHLQLTMDAIKAMQMTLAESITVSMTAAINSMVTNLISPNGGV